MTVYVTLRLHKPNGLSAHLSYTLALILQTCPACHWPKHCGRLLHHCVCVSTSKDGKGHRKFSGLLRAYGNTAEGSLCVMFRSWKEKEGRGIKQLECKKRKRLQSQEGELLGELPTIPTKVLLARAPFRCLSLLLSSLLLTSPQGFLSVPTAPQVSTHKSHRSSEHLYHHSPSL